MIQRPSGGNMTRLARLPVVIDYLTDHRAACPVVVEWLHRQWFSDLGFTCEETAAEVGRRLSRSAPPLTLIALAGGQPVGTVSLIPDDGDPQPVPPHCLSGLFVLPAWRHRGVGSRLCRRIAREARRLGLPKLHLYTPDRATFYQRVGWRPVVDTVVELGSTLELVTFMEWDMRRPQPRGRLPGLVMYDGPPSPSLISTDSESRRT